MTEMWQEAFSSRDGERAYFVKCLPCGHGKRKKPDRVAHAYYPCDGEAETGRSPGLTGQPV